MSRMHDELITVNVDIQQIPESDELRTVHWIDTGSVRRAMTDLLS